MKKFFLLLILCLNITLLSACNQLDAVEENNSSMTESTESSNEDVWVGEITAKEPSTEVVESISVAGNENSVETTHTGEDELLQQEIQPTESEEKDIYVGEYNAYDVNEPNLQIQKNEDGTYTIQIRIFRLVYLDDGIGTLTEKGIEFVATAPNCEELTGTLVVEGEIATVKFTNEVWAEYSSINEYRYYKTSDIPNIYVPNY